MMQLLGDVLKKATQFLKDKKVLEPRISADFLLADILKMSRMDLYMNYDRPMIEEELELYRSYIKRRSLHEPVAYILGKQPFFDFELDVCRDVLIPRPETEELVLACENYLNNSSASKVLDLCTGSGAIAISLKKRNPNLRVTASDICANALRVAKKNSEKLGVEINFINSNLFENISEKFDLIVSNPPYISKQVIQALDMDVKNYEPLLALDGGDDGLDFYKRLICELPKVLKPSGRVFLEIGYDQGDACLSLVDSTNFSCVHVIKDTNQKDRIVVMEYTPQNTSELCLEI